MTRENTRVWYRATPCHAVRRDDVRGVFCTHSGDRLSKEEQSYLCPADEVQRNPSQVSVQWIVGNARNSLAAHNAPVFGQRSFERGRGVKEACSLIILFSSALMGLSRTWNTVPVSPFRTWGPWSPFPCPGDLPLSGQSCCGQPGRSSFGNDGWISTFPKWGTFFGHQTCFRDGTTHHPRRGKGPSMSRTAYTL